MLAGSMCVNAWRSEVVVTMRSNNALVNDRCKLPSALIWLILSFALAICAVTPYVPVLTYYDAMVLHALNPDAPPRFLDALLLAITRLGKNPLFILLLITWLIWRRRWRAIGVIGVLIIAIACTDLLTGKVAKRFWQRPRPARVDESVRAVESPGHSFSFPSAHASNWFAGARVLSALVPEGCFAFYILAVLVAYSRIYLGVHYPTDVVAGAISGYLISSLLLWLLMRIPHTHATLEKIKKNTA